MKKMILVDPNSYRKPMQKEMSKLDEEMSQILNSALEESEKIKQYNQVLQKYLSLKERTINPRLVLEEEEKPIPAKDILKGFTKKNLIQAKKLLESIENNSSASWNSRGELIFDKTPIPQSNIKKLITDKIKKETKSSPGSEQFRSLVWESL